MSGQCFAINATRLSWPSGHSDLRRGPGAQRGGSSLEPRQELTLRASRKQLLKRRRFRTSAVDGSVGAALPSEQKTYSTSAENDPISGTEDGPGNETVFRT